MNTYKTYKDSGVDWIGEIPKHWEIKKMKWITSIKRGASPRPIADTKYFDDENGEFSWVRIADVSASERYLLETKEKLSELGSSLSVKRYPGDFFLSIAGSVGKPIITKIKCCIHDGFVWFPELKLNPEFLYYIFQSDLPFGGLGKVGTQLNLNTETIGNIQIPFISDEDVTSIITYLDHKTQIIDALIEKKEQLIKKLQAQRQAIINEAVTKGLNPNSKMKDSGIEWLGEIPEHWEVKKIKHEFNNLNNIRVPLSSSERGEMKIRKYDYYGASGVIDKVENYLFEDKNILIGEDGANLLTRSKRLAFIAKGQYWVNNHAHIIHPKKGNIEYMAEMLELIDYTPLIVGAAQPKLTQDALNNIYIPAPPVEEQNLIMEYLTKIISKNNKSSSLLTKQVKKLKSYRQSIISEAVTGKIDVREWQAPSKN